MDRGPTIAWPRRNRRDTTPLHPECRSIPSVSAKWASALATIAGVILWLGTTVVSGRLLAWAGRTGMALPFIGIVSIEVLILGANQWRCPLTAVAARYTDDQPDNFDIYLPLWLARYNKEIFGSLYLGGVVVTALRWLGWLG